MKHNMGKTKANQNWRFEPMSDRAAMKREFTEAERSTLAILRLDSLRGRMLNQEDMDWLQKMYAENPEEYVAIGKEIKEKEINRIRGIEP